MNAGDQQSTDPLESALFRVPPADYGPEYRSHVLSIYSTYLEMADHISQRRENANSFFLTVNTALVAVLARDYFGSGGNGRAVGVLAPLAAIFLCYLWSRTIRSYRDLNSAKFKVVHAMERRLPVRPFDAEWEMVGRGKAPKRYLPFTHVERWVPLVFGAFHAVLLASSPPLTTLMMSLATWLSSLLP